LIEQVNEDDIGPSTTEIFFEPENIIDVAGKIKSSKPRSKFDKGFEMNVKYFDGSIEFIIPAKAKKDINFAKDKIQAVLYMQLCDMERCLPPDDYKVIISNEPYETEDTEQITNINAEIISNVIDIDPAPTPSYENDKTIPKTESQMEIEEKKKEGILSFL
jgi:hypothetical protein